jgi:hypothetical protein
MYNYSIPPLKRALTNLAAVLQKGEAFAETKKIEPSVLLNARLAPDMYPLVKQVQIATDISKGVAARLAGLEVPKYEDHEATFPELYARIEKTIAFMNSIQPEQLAGAEEREITLPIRDVELKFTGLDYLLYWAQPNVYFHVVTAYNILRHNGVALGKRDFLGQKRD